MAQNDFLPFGLGASANVLTPGQWAADAERVTGFAKGIARSIKANTAWRQSAFMTAALAQWIMTRTGRDVLDNGDLAALVDALGEGIYSVVPQRPLPLPENHYYVNPTGNNANDGLSWANAWQTIQHGIDWLRANADLTNRVVIFNLAAGTYQPFIVDTPLSGQVHAGQLVIRGNLVNPSSVMIAAVNGNACTAYHDGMFTVEGVRVTASVSGPLVGGQWAGQGLSAADGGWIEASSIDFGECSWTHVISYRGRVDLGAPYTISGPAIAHLVSEHGGYITLGYLGTGGGNVTIIGNPFFQNAFAWCSRTSLIQVNASPAIAWIGAARGRRHVAEWFSAIDGQQVLPVTYFPGDLPGTPSVSNVISEVAGLYLGSDPGLPPRRLLHQATTIWYVNGGTGVNSNDGTTPGTAWRDPAYALYYLATRIDFNYKQAIVQLADGTYGSFGYAGTIPGITAPNQLTVRGNIADPSRVTIFGVNEPAVYCGQGAAFMIDGMTLAQSGGPVADCISVWNMAPMFWYRRIIFGNCDRFHIYAAGGAQVAIVGNCTISGNASAHIFSSMQSMVGNWYHPGDTSYTVTLTGTPTFSRAFVIATEKALYVRDNGIHFVGSASGRRHEVGYLSAIYSNTPGPNLLYFPGDVDGWPNQAGVAGLPIAGGVFA